MSTWDDKPNDYDHAVKLLGAAEAEIARLKIELKKEEQFTKALQIELKREEKFTMAAMDKADTYRAALEEMSTYPVAGDAMVMLDIARKALAKEGK